MKRFNIVLIILLSLMLSGLLFLRWKAREEPAVPVIAETAPPAPVPTAAPTPAPAPVFTPTPPPTPAPTLFTPPRGYTEESYNLVSDMVYAYADRQDDAAEIIRDDLEQLNVLDPALGALWGKIMPLWSEVNRGLVIHDSILPDGQPEDESLCIVVLGFQLHPDGSMAEELRGRCETALRCAEKYPKALIAVTGGGTAWQNPNATEAGVMAAWLTEHGVDASRILVEAESRTTADNAVFTCALLRERHPEVKSLAIVTSDYHMPLGVLLFQEEALLAEYETGTLPFSVVSNAALDTGGRISPDTPMMQRSYLWSIADPKY
ncbi:MAG: YdcF family protein [Oscillospiraceae bacterium]|nr:YdcF family protein [Oscillospiraceae bacterium]